MQSFLKISITLEIFNRTEISPRQKNNEQFKHVSEKLVKKKEQNNNNDNEWKRHVI